jgi:hypothetical protein
MFQILSPNTQSVFQFPEFKQEVTLGRAIFFKTELPNYLHLSYSVISETNLF